MRLSNEEQRFIVATAKTIFSDDTEIWLFGSRCDDNARGGDIDLYIETPALNEPVKRKIDFKLALFDKLEEQKIDIILHQRNRPLMPIHEIAKTQGLKLSDR